MKKSTENLNELLKHFSENAPTHLIVQEIRQGDELLDYYPAPLLNAAAKAKILLRLKAMRPHHHRGVVLKWVAAVAAVVLGIVLIRPGKHLSLPENRPQARSAPTGSFKPMLWEETLFRENEKFFSRINAELDNIAETIESVRLTEINDRQNCFTNELSTEQRESPHDKTNFWQG
jgi:hypothetical protein